jgi:hypothetical protein
MAASTITRAELQAMPTVIDLPTAARALGLGRTKAYELAKAGQFPVGSFALAADIVSPPLTFFGCLGCPRTKISIRVASGMTGKHRRSSHPTPPGPDRSRAADKRTWAGPITARSRHVPALRVSDRCDAHHTSCCAVTSCTVPSGGQITDK